MSFSGVVKVSDIDDYIGLENECTKPVELTKTKGKVKITRGKDGAYKNNRGQTLEKAKITLEDCLACSGCVTSAETVLITQQSLDEFKSALAKENANVVVTLSPQSALSIAQRFSLSPLDALRLTRGIMSGMGVSATRDLTPYRDVCLVQVCEEFERHLASGVKAPLLCSSCPGFVCYAEKTNSKLLVPNLSTVRSPQQISGLWLKQQTPSAYHVAIMPCYDKKLEAVRSEFQSTVDGTTIRDVDCVLATVELEQLIEDKIKAQSIDEYINRGTIDGEELYTHGGGGSGGYLEAILRHISRVKFGLELDKIEYTAIRRNKDFLETVVTIDGEVKLRFAKAYGFRSIQNLVSRLKQSKLNFDYVEVMACPSGCLNGGGQIRYKDIEENKTILKELIEKYNQIQSYPPGRNAAHGELFDDLATIKNQLSTSFRIIEKTDNPLATNNW